MRQNAYTHFNEEINSESTYNLVEILKLHLEENIDRINQNEYFKDDSIKLQEAVNAVLGIEAIAYAITQICPNENYTRTFTDIVVSKDFNLFKNLCSEKKKILHNIHLLFPQWLNNAVVEKNIRLYELIDYKYKHVKFKELNLDKPLENGTFEWNNFQTKDKAHIYKEYLLKQVKHSQQDAKFAESRVFIIEDDINGDIFEISIDNSKYSFVNANTDDFHPLPIDYKDMTPIKIKISELIDTAKMMDEQDENLGIEESHRKNWENRIRDILVLQPDKTELSITEEITIDGTQHWIGKLSVGKSTIMDVISSFMAQNGKTSVLVLNSASEVFEKVDYFNKIGIKTVPLVSYTPRSREQHIKQYMSSLRKNDENIYDNKTFRYLNNTCLLMGLDRKEKSDYIKLKDGFPCFKIKEKKKNGEIKKESKVCPYITSCPYYNSFHDLNDAKIVVTTSNSLSKVRIPKPFTSERITYLEYLIRRANLFFIDESDRVQDTLDQAFVSAVSLWQRNGDWISQTIGNLLTEKNRTHRIIDDPYVVTWTNNLHICSILTNRIVSFLSRKENRKIIKNIRDKTFTGYKLWNEIAEKIAKHYKTSNTDEYRVIIDILMKQYDYFRRTFQSPSRQGIDNEMLHEIAENVTNEEKQIGDIQKFVDEEMFRILSEEMKKKNLGYIKIDIDIEKEEIDKWVYLAMTVALLEIKLNSVFIGIPTIRILMPKLLNDDDPINRITREFDGIIPQPPIGARFGFKFGDKDGEPTLKLFRYLGVGRYILNRLSHLYEVVDEHRGAHCILLSGTSYAPGSSKYNIDIPVSYLLKSNNEKNNKIRYEFLDTFSEKVSGINGAEKYQAYTNIIRRLSEKEELFGSGISKLDQIFEELDEGRKKLLMVVGSYEDSGFVSDKFNNSRSEYSSIPLSRGHEETDKRKETFLRQKVHTFGEMKHEVLVAPLKAMDRGHNILAELDKDKESYDSKGNQKVAAFGGTVFLNRPFTIPDDFGVLINNLNYCYMDTINNEKYEATTVKEEVENLRRKIYKELTSFDKACFGYSSLERADRERLLVDTFIDTWQLEGRLIRGGVDARVYFADSSFAPNTKEGVENDSISTSMLLGWKYLWKDILENPVNEKEGLIKTILEELYSIRLEGLKDINVAE